MDKQEQLKKDLEVMEISEVENLTTRFVTAKYRRLAKERHPDRDGGNTGVFQELQGAYKRIIRYLEELENYEEEEDFEKEFFMKNNIMKEYSTSFVVYIQDGKQMERSNEKAFEVS